MRTFIIALFLVSVGFAQGLLYTYEGVAAGDSLGISLVGAGDIDQDGYADFVVGAHLADANGIDSGAAYVYSGRTGTPIYSFAGQSAGDRFGVAVGGGADVTGDGIPDIAVGASGCDINAPQAGAVYIFSGATGALTYTLSGLAANSWLGESVALGDLDNDGYAEIVAGGYSQAGLGTAVVFNGINGTLASVLAPPFVSFTFGYEVDVVGDTDGDGFGDILVVSSSPAWNEPTLYSGATGALLLTVFISQGVGSSLGVDFSRAGAGVGDVDGDGLGDLVLGSFGLGGNLVAVSGATGDQLWRVYGDLTRGFWPTSVESCGDLDGDGVNDVVTGSGNATFSGAESGSMQVFSGADGALMFTIWGDETGSYFGARVACLGDVNGDGIDDVAGGGYGAQGSTGEVRVYSSWYTASPWALAACKGEASYPIVSGPLVRSGRPVLGGSTTVEILRAPAGAATALVVDAGWPVPWSLGADRVWLDVANAANWVFLTGIVPSSMQVSVPVNFPSDPILLGTPMTAQAVFADPAAPSSLSLSNGLFWQFGN